MKENNTNIKKVAVVTCNSSGIGLIGLTGFRRAIKEAVQPRVMCLTVSVILPQAIEFDHDRAYITKVP